MDTCYKLARERMDHDRRLDAFDKDRLVAKVKETGSNGGYLDLTDPFLYGGSKRPLSR
jgi:hypothetical protein